MAGAKTKEGKGRAARSAVPDDVAGLIALIIGEAQSPLDLQQLLDRMPPTVNCSKEASEFLKAKDRAQRREAFIKTEPLWFNKYGWFMARIVGLFGIIVFALALFTRGAGADFIITAVVGAGVYYLLLVTLSNIRYRENNKKRLRLLEQESQKYQREIIPIASSLMKRFRIDPRLYPVTNPRSKAGLEGREDGFYIPVE
jgi:hypothetical protein